LKNNNKKLKNNEKSTKNYCFAGQKKIVFTRNLPNKFIFYQDISKMAKRYFTIKR